jgi:gluconate kinase
MIIIALLLSQLERLEQPNENEGNAILSTGTWG